MVRHKVTDARRGPPRDCLDIVRETIITVSGMEAGHCQEMLEDMVGQIAAAQFLGAPLLQRYINISDGPTECVGIFRRQAVHVLVDDFAAQGRQVGPGIAAVAAAEHAVDFYADENRIRVMRMDHDVGDLGAHRIVRVAFLFTA